MIYISSRKTENYRYSKTNYNSIIIWISKSKKIDNTPNQPTKFRTKTWVKINDESHGTYNSN